jgi:hypothetical protein
MTMSEAEIENPVIESAELSGTAVEIEARPAEPATELPPAKRVTKRRSTRKTTSKKLAAAAQMAKEAPSPRPRRRRRSALAIPALLDPVLVPEDAEGRVEFIVQALPAWPDPPAAAKTRGKRKSEKESPESHAVPVPASVPWSTVAAIAVAMIVVFVVGAIIAR